MSKVSIKRVKPVIRMPRDKGYRIFEMYEWEVKFDKSYFHLSLLKDRDYHNAYDADENGTLFRADAIFKHKEGNFEVPVFASKDRKGKWKWLIRFRPHLPGRWDLSLYVLHWHTNKHPRGEPKQSKKTRIYNHKSINYYEHTFGPKRLRSFFVNGKPPCLEGTLERFDSKLDDNPNYFYRRGVDGVRKPFFLLGFARPWVTKTKGSPWDSFLDRRKELFEPMEKAGCNVLYHWMAPGETQLVHQAKDEYWFDKKSGFFKGSWKNNKLPDSNRDLGYKRFDQGRASRTDEIFDLAKIEKKNKYILIFLVVMPHSLLQEENHNWNEWAWKPEKGKAEKDIEFAKFNGFQFFEYSPSNKISIKQFFEMKPGDGSWKTQLWKHFANYWRYIIGRWTAHHALGAWVIMDELEGVGNSTSWWWDNSKLTYDWHDNLIKMMRGKLPWGKVGGKDLFYIGDYLKHPITSSTTHYEGTTANNPKLFRGSKKKTLEELKSTGSSKKALQMINDFGELKNHGTWLGKPKSKWKIDFVSHHAYQAVPTWGFWATENSTKNRKYIKNYKVYNKNKDDYTVDSYLLSKCNLSEFRFVLPNQSCTGRIAPDRWLWDSLCMRLRNWSKANNNITRLITEYGCVERDTSNQKWNHYGKRVPSFTHYANWSAFVLGHAGIPFKWNDGGWHGEMVHRTSSGEESPVWKKQEYPVDNYKEIKNVAYFLSMFKVNLKELYPEELEIVYKNDRKDKNFNAWALVNRVGTKLIAWIYDRTFTTNGQAINRLLKIENLHKDLSYHFSWYDTWAGLPIVSADPSQSSTMQPDSKGILRIPLPRFPKANKGTVIGDGNNIAIYLTASLPRS